MNEVRCTKISYNGKLSLKIVGIIGLMFEILRLIQSIPSKKAEPFKMWLAKVGDEKIKN